MKFLGSTFEATRGVPMQRNFTRPILKREYREAIAMTEASDCDLADLFMEGVTDTNDDASSVQSRGAMKFVAVADRIVGDFEQDQRLTDDDVERIAMALNAYHFAANTFRRHQQFELSADFYTVAARVGFALAKSIDRPGEFDARRLASLFDLTDRSYMRARAVCKETGADDRVQQIFIDNRDFRLRRASLEKHRYQQLVLSCWRLLSGYGTSLLRISMSFLIWVMLLAHVYVWLHGLAAPRYPAALWESLLQTLGETRSTTPKSVFIDGALRVSGFFWTALLGQLILQRVLARA
ncbi:hypothetical protein [Hoeflea olei]|uniref:Uncharacterized protein n=1 Tax=Hoeflea olei TaxID=1480615 RepID=A0A1C1YTS5_9HYPH|nr:hypothetical protein [Hoeflea olei]OCW56750.1 hypothetical protein AWJ14_17660 [Hoeflea olei]